MDSPRTVITDTNIWIDLHRGGITTEVFKLGLLFKTPDLVANEILSPSIASLKRHGLDIIELPGVQVLEIGLLKPSSADGPDHQSSPS